MISEPSFKPSAYLFTAVIWAACNPLCAAPINSPGDLSANATAIDFEAFTAGTLEPISNGFATIRSSAGNQTVHAQGFTQFPSVFGGQYFGFDVTSYSIEFSQPVSEFGMGVFDPNSGGNVLRALDSDDNVLEFVTSAPGDEFFPTGPVGGVFSTFVGFTRQTADIARVELINVGGGEILGIDTVTYAAVPEPTSVSIFAVASVGFLWTRRRNRRYHAHTHR